jgi:hypothetical protein
MEVNTMSEMSVLRRANGEPFSEEINGKRVIPVWSSEQEVARYKERNPELITFLPSQLTRFLSNKAWMAFSNGAEFFLLSEDDHDANLDDGRPMSLKEILPRLER